MVTGFGIAVMERSDAACSSDRATSHCEPAALATMNFPRFTDHPPITPAAAAPPPLLRFFAFRCDSRLATRTVGQPSPSRSVGGQSFDEVSSELLAFLLIPPLRLKVGRSSRTVNRLLTTL
jgi:hypothetical protein